MTRGACRASATPPRSSSWPSRPKSPARSRPTGVSAIVCAPSLAAARASNSVAPASRAGSNGASSRSCSTRPVSSPSTSWRSRSIDRLPPARVRGALRLTSLSLSRGRRSSTAGRELGRDVPRRRGQAELAVRGLGRALDRGGERQRIEVLAGDQQAGALRDQLDRRPRDRAAQLRACGQRPVELQAEQRRQRGEVSADRWSAPRPASPRAGPARACRPAWQRSPRPAGG